MQEAGSGYMTHFDRLGVVPLLGAMVRCHCWVPCGKVPLLGAIAGCNGQGVVTTL